MDPMRRDLAPAGGRHDMTAAAPQPDGERGSLFTQLLAIAQEHEGMCAHLLANARSFEASLRALRQEHDSLVAETHALRSMMERSNQPGPAECTARPRSRKATDDGRVLKATDDGSVSAPNLHASSTSGSSVGLAPRQQGRGPISPYPRANAHYAKYTAGASAGCLAGSSAGPSGGVSSGAGTRSNGLLAGIGLGPGASVGGSGGSGGSGGNPVDGTASTGAAASATSAAVPASSSSADASFLPRAQTSTPPCVSPRRPLSARDEEVRNIRDPRGATRSVSPTFEGDKAYDERHLENSRQHEDEQHGGSEDRLDLAGFMRSLPESYDFSVQQRSLQSLQRYLRRHPEASEVWRGSGATLGLVVKAGRPDLAGALLRAKSNPNDRDKKGVTSLHLAVFDGNADLCRVLLGARAEVDACDRHGQTPLFFAPTRDVCKLLVDRKSDVGILNRKGQSALHLAGRAGLQDVLEWLAPRVSRSLVELRDVHGATAGDYAREAGMSDVAEPRCPTHRQQLPARKRGEQRPGGRTVCDGDEHCLEPLPEEDGEDQEAPALALLTCSQEEKQVHSPSSRKARMSPHVEQAVAGMVGECLSDSDTCPR